jgi:hypothetical protein
MTKKMASLHQKLSRAVVKARKEKKVLVQEVRNLRDRTSSAGSEMFAVGAYPVQLQKGRPQSELDGSKNVTTERQHSVLSSESVSSIGTSDFEAFDLPGSQWSFADSKNALGMEAVSFVHKRLCKENINNTLLVAEWLARVVEGKVSSQHQKGLQFIQVSTVCLPPVCYCLYDADSIMCAR